MSQRVSIVALGNIRNIGEDILAEATALLVRRACPDVVVLPVQFCPGGRGEDFIQRAWNFLSRRALWLARHIGGAMEMRLMDVYYRLRLGRHFSRVARSSDAIILAVGMFKHSSQDFSYLYRLLARKASCFARPLMMSAASIAEPDVHDWRSLQLARTVREKCWRMVTTRDGEKGLELLRSGYGLPEAVEARAVGDPALWLPELTGVVRPDAAGRTLIGINLVRGRIYETYRGGVTEERLLEVYRELIAELDARGLEWRLFSNGTRSDEKFGDLLCSRLGIPSERRLPPPNSVREFARTIVSFKAIFGARLHACLTAIAFRVPSVWLDWDEKFSRTAESLGYLRALLKPSDLDGKTIVNRLEEMMARPFDERRIEAAKRATADSLTRFLKGEEISK